jgi:PAS domain S-box-containing protein
VLHQPQYSFLQGGGEMGERIRRFNWSKTSIGEPELWPSSLRTTLSIILNTKFPMFLIWGDELICFYNDAFRSGLSSDGKYPDALGKPGAEAWPEIWDIIKPLIDEVLYKGEAIWKEDQLVPFYRNGHLENGYWTFSYSPVFNEQGKARGVFVTCNETTEKLATVSRMEKTSRRFTNLVRQAPVAIAVFRGKDLIADIVNDAYLLLVGKTGEELMGKPMFQSMPELKEEMEPIARELLRSGKPFQVNELQILLHRNRKDETCFFNFTWEPLQEEDGSIDGVLVVASEVTEQVQTRKKVEESEQRFQNLVRDASVGIVLLAGEEMKVILVNEAYVRLIDRRVEELLNKPLFSIIPEAEESFRTLLNNVRLTGESVHLYDHPYTVHANGKTIKGYLNVTYQPYHEADGSITGVLALCQDVTEQVLARKKAEEAEERTMIAVDAAELGTVEVDLLTNETVSSPRMDAIFGVEHSSERKNYIAVIHPDDLPVRNKAYENAFETGLLEYEARLLKKNNTIRWIRAKGKVFFNEQKKPVRLFGVVQDITEEKKFAEELARHVNERTAELEMSRREIERAANRLHSVFNNAQSGMFIFTPVKNEHGEVVDFRFVITNPMFASYVGQIPEMLDGELGSKWFPGYLTNGVFDMYKQTYLTGETKRQDIHYYVDGLDIYLDLMSSKVGHEVLVTFTDYTQLKRAQLQLEKYVEDLKRSNVNLEEFAYAASHDLKEPIRKVHVFSDRLKQSLQGRLTEEEAHFFERMLMATRRMNLLIDDLLSYSQVSLRPRHFEEVNLNSLIELVIGDLDLEIEEKKAAISVDKLFAIKGNHRQLQQAFQNLLSNALKYSKHDVSPRISISCSKVMGHESGLQLSPSELQKLFYVVTIKDNGIGFEQADAERIFNVFTRLHGNAEFRGTGVGLSIVRKVLENHNGYITAESTPGEGATFKLYFPEHDV